MRLANIGVSILGCVALYVMLLLLATPPLNEGPKHGKIVKFKPQMSDQIPTFEQNVAADIALREALENSEPDENPEFKIARENLLSLLQDLRNDPCNKDLRKKYARTVQSFRKNVDKDWDRYPPEKWPEIMVVDGRPVDISIQFNRPVIEEIILSVSEGFLMPGEVTDKYKLGSQIGFYKARQESCANNTEYVSPDDGNFRNEWEEIISSTDRNTEVEENYDQDEAAEQREEMMERVQEILEERDE